MRSLKIPMYALSLMTVIFGQNSKAQWGSGMYGAMPSCPGGMQVAGGATDEIDRIREIQAEVTELKARQKELKADIREIEKDIEATKRTIGEVLNDGAAGMVTEHIEISRSCSEYKGFFTSTNGKTYTKAEATGSVEVTGIKSGETPVNGVTEEQWGRICDRTKKGGVLTSAVCSQEFAGKAKMNAGRCSNAINGLGNKISKRDKYQEEQNQLTAQLEILNDSLKEGKRDLRKAVREAQKEQTEGGCVECQMSGSGYVYKAPERSTGDVLAGVGVGLLGLYAGYRGSQNAISANERLGFPTNPAMGMGYPFAMAMGAMSLYGAVSGGMGGGAYGCAGVGGGMYGAGGMMGYPGGMYGGYPGGGMWMPGGGYGGGYGMGMPGMGMAGGLAGGMGMAGMGYPGMGMAGMGYPGMGMAGMGYPGMGMAGMGYPGMGMAGMGYPGMGMAGGMAGGFGLAGGMGMAGMGYPGMGMAGMGYPGMGMAGGMAGGFAGGLAGGMGYPGMGMAGGMAGGMGYPGMGMAGMGMAGMGYPGMGMAGGLAGGIGLAGGLGMAGMGYPGMGMAGGYAGGMAGGLAGGLAGGMAGGMDLQYQQQMMQMQQQQLQTWMETQRRAQENEMAKQRAVSGLQQELYSLIYRIQQVQYGVGVSGSSGGYVGGSYNLGTTIGPSTGVRGTSGTVPSVR